MGRNLDPKCKQCRRAGEKLFLKSDRCNSPKCAMVKRNFPPGFHGPKGKKRQTDYGMQLAEKQKAKKTYDILEKQFRLTLDKAQKKQGDAGKNLFKLLEFRLDNVVYRMGFAGSRNQARQLVNHGHFLVNGKKVDIPSFVVKPGDLITIKNKSKRSKAFTNLSEKLLKFSTISWLSIDPKALSAKVLHEPLDTDLPANINAQIIIEFYSK